MAATQTPCSELTAKKIVGLLQAGQASAEEVAKSFLERTRQTHQQLNSHLHFDENAAIAEARAADRLIREKGVSELPLAGVPVLIKDNICVRGSKTTCGSRMLGNYVAPYDATVISRLRAAGAFVLGKTNMDEFAMGSSSENSAFGPVRNPWHLDHVPGGSSGGSGAAVAAGLAPVALGSDTGGSIRQPASFCGITGLKPTYGSVSRFGLVAFGSSLDQIGPMTTTVEDAAMVYDVLAGLDPRDSTSVNHPQSGFAAALSTASLKGRTIGVPDELLDKGVDPEVARCLERAIGEVQAAGATVKKVRLPNIASSVAAYYVIATAEASANLARFDGVRYGYRAEGAGRKTLKELYRTSRSQGFGREVKQRIMLGTFVLSSGYYDAFYAKANKARELITRDFSAVFDSGCDLILTPTSPTPPFKLGEKLSDPVAMYLSDVCTIGVNLAGLPAISVPCGLTTSGLPVGMQLIARKFNEKSLLTGAYAYERATDWHKARPCL
ncbi:MAG: Glutamyl-tRNA(Gln) amidotransferase subunit [Pseudomonadota bacterium]|jgi:aspartyl-tRNA(Asn)/glutamyl-tRNA(Gln) amidotransferase subunit A